MVEHLRAHCNPQLNCTGRSGTIPIIAVASHCGRVLRRRHRWVHTRLGLHPLEFAEFSGIREHLRRLCRCCAPFSRSDTHAVRFGFWPSCAGFLLLRFTPASFGWGIDACLQCFCRGIPCRGGPGPTQLGKAGYATSACLARDNISAAWRWADTC